MNADTKKFTYCPECGKLLKRKKSDDKIKNKLCLRCRIKYRPRF